MTFCVFARACVLACARVRVRVCACARARVRVRVRVRVRACEGARACVCGMCIISLDTFNSSYYLATQLSQLSPLKGECNEINIIQR